MKIFFSMVPCATKDQCQRDLFIEFLQCLQTRLQTFHFTIRSSSTHSGFAVCPRFAATKCICNSVFFSCQLYVRNHHIQPNYKPPSQPLNRSLTFPVASVDPIRSWSFMRGHCVHHTGKTVAGATQRIHVPTREVRPNPKRCFFFLVIKKDGWASR